MSEHVKRGATKHKNRDVSYDWNGPEGGQINSVWCCDECGDTLEVRQRAGKHAYVEIGCSCGASSLDLRISDLFEFEMESWDTVTVSELGRGSYE